MCFLVNNHIFFPFFTPKQIHLNLVYVEVLVQCGSKYFRGSVMAKHDLLTVGKGHSFIAVLAYSDNSDNSSHSAVICCKQALYWPLQSVVVVIFFSSLWVHGGEILEGRMKG